MGLQYHLKPEIHHFQKMPFLITLEHRFKDRSQYIIRPYLGIKAPDDAFY